ncbi:MAG: hypothetical protein QNJ65_15640 [Xenococcaceae cyanobacterium MO_234.B1]|nr:hypothetical protein [Xenococcaceae cyanobacterium MO_234.B1]
MPNYRSVIWGLTGEKRTEHLRKIEEHLTRLLQRAQHFGAFLLAGAIYSSLAELFAIGGEVNQAFRIFENLTNAYRESNNAVGNAWCLMCQGDLLASPAPLGKPILFGYHLSNSTTYTTVSANPQLFDRSAIDRDRARTFYREAQQYFAATVARRGEGMVLLRLAYLDATAEE